MVLIMLGYVNSFLSIAFLCVGVVVMFDLESLSDINNYQTSDEDTIVGGYNASIKEFPYQIAMYWGKRFLCGGSIISENYVLTAAHCLDFLNNTDDLVIHIGSEWRRRGISIPIEKMVINPDYNTQTIDKDVGIMKTAKPIQFTDVVKSIKLPSKNKPVLEGSTVTVSGWGLIGANEGSSEYLMAVKVPVVTKEKCKAVFGNKITKNMWCAGGLKTGGKGVCTGDSGGPAVQGDEVVGIVSFGRACANPNIPDVYVYVASPEIRDFITEYTGL